MKVRCCDLFEVLPCDIRVDTEVNRENP